MVDESPDVPPPRPHRRQVAWRLALSYAVVAGLWIALSDQLLNHLLGGAPSQRWVALGKGLLFVVVTAVALGWLVHRLLAREQAARAAHDEAARLLQAVVDHSPDAIFAKDRQGRYLMFNREAARVTGVPAEQVLGRGDDAVFPVAQAAQIRANDETVMARDQACSFEERLDTTDGPVVYLATKGPLRDARGQVVGMYGISRNISELAAARDQLQRSERQYRLMFEANPQPMWVQAEADGRMLAVNQAALQHYGYSRPEFLALTADQLKPAPGRLPLLAHVEPMAGLEGDPFGARGRSTHCRADGRLIELELVWTTLDHGGVPARMVLAQDVTQRQLLERQREAAHQAMQAAHEQLNKVLARVDDGFIALDRDWCYSYVNQRAAEMLGRQRPEDLLGRHIWTEFPEGVGQPFQKAYEQAMATQQAQVFEQYFSPWDRWFENRVYPSPDGLSIYFSEVTARKRAERELGRRDAELRLSEQRYRLAAAGGQVWDWDFALGRETVPALFWDGLGRPTPAPEKTLAVFEACIHPDDLATWKNALREHLARRVPYRISFRMQHASGEWRWFLSQGQAVWDSEGRATYMAGTTFDITARKRAEEALRASESYRRGLFEQLAEGLIVVDVDHRIVDANPAALTMLGYERQALLARKVQDVLAPADRHRVPAWSQGHPTQAVQVAEWEHLRADGSRFPAEVSMRRLDDHRLLAVLRDITERRRIEGQLMRHQLELSELTRQLLAQEQSITRRMAQSLHDHLGQTLASARLHLDAALAVAAGRLPPDLQAQCERLSPLLDRAVQEVRQVLVDLRPPLLEADGLGAALDNELRKAAAVAGDCQLVLDLPPTLAGTRWPGEVEYAAFMIAREAIGNTLRHAQARQLRVRLRGDAGALDLDLLDDGIGLAAWPAEGRPGHLGLVGMRERAIGIGARLTLSAPEGGGTQVSLVWRRA